MVTLSIKVFGSTAVMDGERRLTGSAIGGAKVRRVLAILALHAGTPVSKDRLADLLWEARLPASPATALDTHVCLLRRSLGAAGRRTVIRTTGAGYLLDPDQANVDLLTFSEAADALVGAAPGTHTLHACERALALVAGELLADEPFAPWAQDARDQCRRQQLSLLQIAGRSALLEGDFQRAVRLARGAQRLAPTSTQAAQQAMRALWLSGRRLDALRVYADLRASMLDEFGEGPDSRTHELYLAILRHREVQASREDARRDLRILLDLLRQTLDVLPGPGAPAADTELERRALLALAEVSREDVPSP